VSTLALCRELSKLLVTVRRGCIPVHANRVCGEELTMAFAEQPFLLLDDSDFVTEVAR